MVSLNHQSDYGGHSKSDVWLYPLSSLPHVHTMDKNMVNQSSSDFITYYSFFVFADHVNHLSHELLLSDFYPLWCFTNQSSLNWLIQVLLKILAYCDKVNYFP
ncbi:hypothetical protein XENOCAPTIV_015071 [Xenoophorus captivus]|uniref:Uncharacterized protein n=1 Tax=Xenoophorus captivus TaxID=1517983 RepID=A0ABV0QID2_9TELE